MELVRFDKYPDGRAYVVIDTTHPCMECDSELDIRVELGQGEVELLLEQGELDYTIDRSCDEDNCDGFNRYTLLQKSSLEPSQIALLETWVENGEIIKKVEFTREQLNAIGDKVIAQFPELELEMQEDTKGCEMYFFLKSQGFEGDNFSIYPNGMKDKELEEEWDSFGYLSEEALVRDLVKSCDFLVTTNKPKGKGR